MTEVVRDDEPKKPVRTCAGCGRAEGADAMLRLVLGPNGEVAVDMKGGAFGRGTHLHAEPACVTKACKGGFSRSFKRQVTADAQDVAEQIQEACNRRVQGLLLAARRSNRLAMGTEATEDALRGDAPLVVVAADARAASETGGVRFAISEGKAVVFGTKATLGALFGRDEVAVCAVRDARIADEIAHARRSADAVASLGRRGGS